MMSNENRVSSRIALVFMPWGPITHPSVGLGILKQAAKNVGVGADVFYLNLQFAAQIGLDTYQQIANYSALYPEWFFASHLFGQKGLASMDSSWEALQRTASGRAFAEKINLATGRSEDVRSRVLSAAYEFMQTSLREVDWQRYIAVGFSSTFAQTSASLWLAREIKQWSPEMRIIFGGANLESEMGEETLRAFSWIDFVVHGEAEQTFPLLLKSIVSGEPTSIPGVSVQSETMPYLNSAATPVRDLDSCPIPDYEEYFQTLPTVDPGQSLRVSMWMETSRGCWWGEKHHCTFCGLNGEGMVFRRKSPERAYEELIALSRKHGMLTINFSDNILDMRSFKDLLPAIAAANLDFTLFAETKANLTKAQVGSLAISGMGRIQPGIESFSTSLLRRMDKGVTQLQNIRLLKWCAEYGIEPMWNLLHGFPGETQNEYDGLPFLMRKLFHLRPPIDMCPIVFERFSPYHSEPERFGLMLEPLSAYEWLYPSTVDLRKLAYYFDGQWSESQADVEHAQGALHEWRRAWNSGSVYCYYNRGPDFIAIRDNRPLAGTNELRTVTLRGAGAAIYEYCDDIRAANAIQNHLSDKGAVLASNAIVQFLASMVELGLMVCEDGKYLSVATRGRTKRLLQRVHSA